MTNSELEFYRSEYENDPTLTIQGLCNKYNIQPTQLGDTSQWKKVVELVKDKRPLKLGALQIKTAPKPENKPLANTPKEQSAQEKIEAFKDAVIVEALQRVQFGASSMEAKELKELVQLIDTIDKSRKGTSDATSVQILVQNIVNNFKDDV